MDHRHHWIWSPGHTACLFIHIYMYKYIRTGMVAYVLCTNQHWFGCRLEYVFLHIILVVIISPACSVPGSLAAVCLRDRSPTAVRAVPLR